MNLIKENDARDLLSQLDGSGSDNEFDAIRELRKLGEKLPSLLLDKYRTAKKWKTRSSCVYHAIRYAGDVEDAVQLGIEALSDKSHAVRYRACMLLAYSLNKKALPYLEKLEQEATHQETLLDVRAAIDAIKNQNSDFFVDREHSGNVILKVN